MPDATIPVTVLTGFLGSGKTTLLARLLRSPALARTAVVINEFGAVGLDHDLIEASDESLITLQTGCLCCAIRGDLAATLGDLLARRAAGTVTPFERVVIETSGLADPAPILQALMTDAGLAERLVLAGVVTTVDALTGLATLERQPESVKQVAVADRLVVTKLDMLGSDGVGSDGIRAGGADSGVIPAALAGRLAALNPLAPVRACVLGAIDPAYVLDGEAYDLDGRSAAAKAMLADAGDAGQGDGHGHRQGAPHPHAHDPNRHSADIACFAIVRTKPLPAVVLTLLLEILAEQCGADLLRMKGIVNLAESPDQPAVVHGVQHVFHAPIWLDRWPSADRRTRLVFIVRRIPRGWVEAVLAAVEAEVAEVSAGFIDR